MSPESPTMTEGTKGTPTETPDDTLQRAREAAFDRLKKVAWKLKSRYPEVWVGKITFGLFRTYRAKISGDSIKVRGRGSGMRLTGTGFGPAERAKEVVLDMVLSDYGFWTAFR